MSQSRGGHHLRGNLGRPLITAQYCLFVPSPPPRPAWDVVTELGSAETPHPTGVTTALDRGTAGEGQTKVTSEARDRGGGVRAALVSRAADGAHRSKVTPQYPGGEPGFCRA